MAVIQDENLGDLIATTLKDLGEMRFTEIATDLQDHVAMRVLLKKERIEHWLKMGATPSERVQGFLAEIGRRLASKRDDLGMSQHQVARKAKLTAQQLSKYELGLSDPPISTLMRITDVLQMSPTALLIQSMILADTDKRP